jgi:hypothetical protein
MPWRQELVSAPRALGNGRVELLRALLEIDQHLARGVGSRAAGDAAAGMRSRAAEVETRQT